MAASKITSPLFDAGTGVLELFGFVNTIEPASETRATKVLERFGFVSAQPLSRMTRLVVTGNQKRSPAFLKCRA